MMRQIASDKTEENEIKENHKGTRRSSVRKSSRRRAREFALQGLFQWQLNQDSAHIIALFLQESSPHFVKADQPLFHTVFFGCLQEMSTLQSQLAPHLDRPETEISPVEKAILFIATYELLYTPETPYAVVLNEAIELAKTFGGVDGHKFVNGILDKISLIVRPNEIRINKNKYDHG